MNACDVGVGDRQPFRYPAGGDNGAGSNVLVAVIVNSDKLKTLPLGFGVLGGQYGFHFEWTMAAAVITILPVIIVFVVFQEYVIRGIALSGLK